MLRDFAFPSLGNVLARYSHWIGFFGILLGAVLSFYFYFASKQVGEISLSFKTVKIAQAGVPILKILDDKGETITADVYGLEAKVWNTGDISLGTASDRVRRPLTISLSGPIKILGAVVQDTRNLDKADIEAFVESGQKSVSIQWRQFDPADAAKIFIIYTGQNQSPIDYSARIVGTHLSGASEYKETAPNTTGFRNFYDSTVYDWENHKLKLMVSSFAIILQFAALGLLIFKGTTTIWTPALMIVAMVVMLISSTSVLTPSTPF